MIPSFISLCWIKPPHLLESNSVCYSCWLQCFCNLVEDCQVVCIHFHFWECFCRVGWLQKITSKGCFRMSGQADDACSLLCESNDPETNMNFTFHLLEWRLAFWYLCPDFSWDFIFFLFEKEYHTSFWSLRFSDSPMWLWARNACNELASLFLLKGAHQRTWRNCSSSF